MSGRTFITLAISGYGAMLNNSVKVNPEQERELINMSDQTPFDCRANHKATFDDISPVLLEDHLRKTGSKLARFIRHFWKKLTMKM